MPPKWMDFLWFSPARVCPAHHFFQESRVCKCSKDSDKIFSLPKFHGFEWQPPTCWKKTAEAGVAAASVASEKMKEKAADTGTPKTWICFFFGGDAFYLSTKVNHQSSMCLCLFNWICFLGNVLLILSHGESSPWSQPPFKRRICLVHFFQGS